MKSYRVLAWKELLAQKVTSILILIAVILSTVTTTVIGQSIGVLNAMRQQQAITINGEKYATFLQMSEEQLSELKEDARFSYIGASISLGTIDLNNQLTHSAAIPTLISHTKKLRHREVKRLSVSRRQGMYGTVMGTQTTSTHSPHMP